VAVNGTCRARMMFDQIIHYAIGLIGPCWELTGPTSNLEYAEDRATDQPPQQQPAKQPSPMLPMIHRLVLDQEAVA
jgi:hypothetical protein